MELGKHRDEWKELVDLRIEDADVLLRNGRYDAAYYVAGYAVECALKARFTRVLEGFFPPRQSLYTHDLKALLLAAKLDDTLKEDSKANPLLRREWEVVASWSEDSRYNGKGQEAATEAKDMVKAVRGVVKWIEKYW